MCCNKTSCHKYKSHVIFKKCYRVSGQSMWKSQWMTNSQSNISPLATARLVRVNDVKQRALQWQSNTFVESSQLQIPWLQPMPWLEDSGGKEARAVLRSVWYHGIVWANGILAKGWTGFNCSWNALGTKSLERSLGWAFVSSVLMTFGWMEQRCLPLENILHDLPVMQNLTWPWFMIFSDCHSCSQESLHQWLSHLWILWRLLLMHTSKPSAPCYKL